MWAYGIQPLLEWYEMIQNDCDDSLLTEVSISVVRAPNSIDTIKREEETRIQYVALSITM